MVKHYPSLDVEIEKKTIATVLGLSFDANTAKKRMGLLPETLRSRRPDRCDGRDRHVQGLGHAEGRGRIHDDENSRNDGGRPSEIRLMAASAPKARSAIGRDDVSSSSGPMAECAPSRPQCGYPSPSWERTSFCAASTLKCPRASS